MQPKHAVSRKVLGRFAAALIGLLLLAHLVRRAGPQNLLDGIASVGWGLLLIIALAGLAQAVRTLAWRLTLGDVGDKPSFGRMFGLRLASEAAGQVGVFGQVFGDTWRVAELGAELPLVTRVTSVALDRALYTLSSTLVTIAGIVALAFVLPLSGKIALYGKIFGCALVGSLFLAAIAVRRRWPLITGPLGALGGIGKIGPWLEKKQEAIRSVEAKLLDFFHHSPAAFRTNLLLQMAAQVAAVLEVYLILRLMGCPASFVSALAIEGLTKLVNVIGMINPGNAGTYEGGNMLFARLVGMSGTVGLTLGLIRRVRSLFWAAVGVVCAITLPGSSRRQKDKLENSAEPSGEEHTAVILAQGVPVSCLLARVGALPVLLRAIVSAHKACAARIFVVTDCAVSLSLKQDLRRTRRLPDDVQWCTAAAGEIAPVLREVAESDSRIVLIAADRTYHPSLHRRAAEWKGNGVLALTTDGQPAGIYAFSSPQAIDLLKRCAAETRTIEDLLERLSADDTIDCGFVPPDLWQRVSSPEDRLLAEQKLDKWLVKPTDGVFARMNRRVSIPISRRLIPFPITPNMVSYFTLGVGFLAGVFFALGGRMNMLIGAILSVFASILDGCDGEVARLKLQDSAFGCWLETVCDYLYYVFVFAGMTIGLLGRGPVYRIWGAMFFFGAIASFLTIGLQRRRIAGARPEQYLSLWHGQASRRRSNPFLFLGRHAEFLTRRCCMPYLILAFALFGATYMAFIGAAVGANIVWPIALYSYFTFDPARSSHG
ncbi:MAG: lysylphosphatidylglycerol synthase domain-containing protein [Acidobacteriota bacterium]